MKERFTFQDSANKSRYFIFGYISTCSAYNISFQLIEY